MIRMRIKRLATAADACAAAVSMINSWKMVMTRARILKDGSWSILVVDAAAPVDYSPDAVASLQHRVNDLALIFGATIEDGVFEDIDGILHCPTCISVLQSVTSVIDGFFCNMCRSAVYVAGANERGICQ